MSPAAEPEYQIVATLRCPDGLSVLLASRDGAALALVESVSELPDTPPRPAFRHPRCKPGKARPAWTANTMPSTGRIRCSPCA